VTIISLYITLSVSKLFVYKHFFATILFSILSRFLRLLYKLTSFPPPSHKYLSGDLFFSFSNTDHTSLQASCSQSAVVSLPTHEIDEAAPALLASSVPYVLITHNSDSSLDLTCVVTQLLNSPMLTSWYSQNLTFKHPKLYALPIGLENIHYFHNGIPIIFDILRKQHCQKKPYALYGFNIGSNPVIRKPIHEICRKFPCTYYFSSNPLSYLTTLNKYQFVVSPPGNGIDCHRTWEALYLNTIPIVIRSPIYDSFDELPIMILDDWDQLLYLTPEMLANYYAKHLHLFDHTSSPLWASYWRDLIQRASRY
jgi:hypothetical protein